MGKMLMCHGRGNVPGPLEEAEEQEKYKTKCAWNDLGIIPEDTKMTGVKGRKGK